MVFGFIRSFLLFLAGIPVTLVGPLVVAAALPYRRVSPFMRSFTKYPGVWQMVSLPSWARWWNNPVDGALGDERGWWDNYCRQNYDLDCRAFYSMWQWLAIRNPANYFSRIAIGVDASRCTTEIVAQGTHWQLLRATRDDGKLFPLFQGLIPYGNSGRGLEWRIGWKVELETVAPNLPDAERFRGHVFRVRPFKSCD